MNQLLEDAQTGNELLQEDTSRTIYPEDFNEVCRTCMKLSDNMVPILESKVLQNEVKVADLLLQCASVQVNSGDSLPLNICNICLDEILRIHSFQKQCSDVEKTLKELLTIVVKLEIEVNDDEISPMDIDKYDTKEIDDKFFEDEQSEVNFNETLPQINDDTESMNFNDKLPQVNEAIIKQKELPKIKLTKLKARKKRAHLKEAKHSEQPPTKEIDDKFFEDKQSEMNFNDKLPQVNDDTEAIIKQKELPKIKLTKLKARKKRAHLKEAKHSEQPPTKEIDDTFFEDKQSEMNFNDESPQVNDDTEAIIKQKELPKEIPTKLKARKKKAHLKKAKHSEQPPSKEKKSSLKGNLQKRMKIHSKTSGSEEPDKFTCKKCHRIFVRKHFYLKHLKMHTIKDNKNPNGYLCETCNKQYQSEGALKAHLLTHRENEYLCEICNKRYRTQRVFKGHLKTHREKSFKCTDCEKSFATKSYLKLHFRVHTGEKPYTCTLCSKRFRHKCTLNQHMITHSGLKKHHCHLCPKSFSQSSPLKSHLMLHSGIKPFSCNYCNKYFSFKNALQVHLRKHTISEKGLIFKSKEIVPSPNKNHKSLDISLSDIFE